MDYMIENELLNCIACQASSKHKTHTPIKPTQIPSKVWETINIDYLGPLPNGKYIFVIIDQRPRYPIVGITNSTNADKLTEMLDETFAYFGNLENMTSDNGPPFKAEKLRIYLRQKAVKHHRNTPLTRRRLTVR